MKKTYASLVIIMVFMMSIFSSTMAVTDVSLYRAQLPIVSAENAPSNDELKMALAQVLSGLTQQPNIDKDPAWASSLNQAKDLMLSYQYITGDTPQQLTLQIDFDPDAVSRLLKAKGKTSVVSAALPQQLLIWLAISSGNEQRLVGSGSESPYSKIIKNIATQQSINVEWPLLDLTDLNALTFSDVWDGQWSVINTASKRYPHDGVVLVHLSKGEGSTALWTSEWTLKTSQQSVDWTFTANNAEDALHGGMLQLAPMLTKEMKKSPMPVTPAQPLTVSQVQLIVYGVGNLSAMDGLTSSLKQLTPVQTVEIAELSPDEVVFNITCQGGMETLQQAIADHVTSLVKSSATDSSTAANALTYQWAL